MAILSEQTKPRTLVMGTHQYKVFDNESVDETKSDAIDAQFAQGVTLVVETSAGVSSGVVYLEGAQTADYAGTWASLVTITTDAASKTFAGTIGLGATGCPIPYVRARIETVIGGGTIDAYINLKLG